LAVILLQFGKILRDQVELLMEVLEGEFFGMLLQIVRRSVALPQRAAVTGVFRERIAVSSQRYCSHEVKQELTDSQKVLQDRRPMVHSLHIYFTGFVNGQVKEVQNFFKELQTIGRASHDSYYWMIVMLSKYNKKQDCFQLFDEMGEVGRSPKAWALFLQDFKSTFTEEEDAKLKYLFERDLFSWTFRKLDPDEIKYVKKILLLPADQMVHKLNWRTKMDPERLAIHLNEEKRLQKAHEIIMAETVDNGKSNFGKFIAQRLNFDPNKDFNEQADKLTFKDLHKQLDLIAKDLPELEQYYRQRIPPPS